MTHGEPGSVLPHDVLLAAGDRDSSFIFLDIIENTIRVADGDESPDFMNPPGTPLEVPGDPFFYRNFWPRHAPTFLRMQLNKIKALDVIPIGNSLVWGEFIDFEEEWL
ncbi:hypothetical protein OCU04_011686 [Sclerotinia nivalis]|uniref:Uncharacterized protein n=1 Tax=Sclerotinia nivalis TaxID=352851 RepID=A0A9X0DE10_9HELO|nr:hypothetical protein OCU04_011686 [Sclerotinia nivalis]